MGRRRENQAPISGVKEESGSQKLNKRKRLEEENFKLASALAKHLKPVIPREVEASTISTPDLVFMDDSHQIRMPINHGDEIADASNISCDVISQNAPKCSNDTVSPVAVTEFASIGSSISSTSYLPAVSSVKNPPEPTATHPMEDESLQKIVQPSTMDKEANELVATCADKAGAGNILPIPLSSSQIVLTSDHTVIDFSDPSTWPFPMTSTTKTILLDKGPSRTILDFYPKKDGRGFHKSHFICNLPNGSIENRDWLMYSKSTNSLFCFPCCIFAVSALATKTPFSNYGIESVGFTSYEKLSRGIQKHEKSQQHFAALLTWRENRRNHEHGISLDLAAKRTHLEEISFWRKVLRCMLDATLFLARNNLAFRGTSEKIGDVGCGHFLLLLELLSHYYEPLALHIERMNPSPETQNEFISLASNAVRSQILEEIKGRKFFSILLDATPDTSNKEQISQVIRTVRVDKEECKIEENFIDFIHFDKKTGKEISTMIIKKLETDGLDIEDLRGQGYDNGANMAGIHQGVQAHIKRVNPAASYIPCASHSLNLVGQNAAQNCKAGKLILGQVQSLYVFFSASPERWSVLSNKVKRTLKSQSTTRWSAKANAVHALCSEFKNVMQALEEIIESESFNAQTLADSTSQLKQISTFKFLLYLNVWNDILHRIHVTNASIQAVSMDVASTSIHLSGLVDWLKEFEQTGFLKCLEKAKIIAEEVGIPENSGFAYRNTRHKLPARFQVEEPDTVNEPLSNVQKFEIEFFKNVMENLQKEFRGRFQALLTIASDFNFLWGSHLENNNDLEITNAVKDLVLKYSSDLDGGAMLLEAKTVKSHITPFLLKEGNLFLQPMLLTY